MEFCQGAYIQADDAIEQLAARIVGDGFKNVFIYTETPGWNALEGRLGTKLDEARVYYHLHFHGDAYPTYSNNSSLANDLNAKHADVIIGVGGGRVMDASKLLADTLGKNLLLAPTSAAQCASFTALSAIYMENGARNGGIFIKIPILGTYVDMRVMRTAPPRLLAAGIADALTKLAEPYCAVLFGGEATARWDTTLALAGQVIRILFKYSAKALKGNAESLNNVVYAVICLTGLLSSLGGDRPGLPLAHNINDAAHDLYTEIPRQYLHGEIVGVGVLLAAYACEIPGLPANELRGFMKNTLKMPVTWAELGYGISENDFETVLNFITKNNPPLKDKQASIVRDALRSVWA